MDVAKDHIEFVQNPALSIAAERRPQTPAKQETVVLS